MKKNTVILISVIVFVAVSIPCFADQTIVAQYVLNKPVIDGIGDDAAWAEAQGCVTHDTVADIDVTLKAVYTDEKIFFLVTFPDLDESREHKMWVWDREMEIYKQGPQREDVFILKWNLNPNPVDLSVYADEPYSADVWFWKARRTDPVGYADDKIQHLSTVELPESRQIISTSGKTMYIQRVGDEGTAAYQTTMYTEYTGDTIAHFAHSAPTGSRADIKAKGVWSDNKWVIEFERDLNTGNEDDIQFDKDAAYQFGVSRYEIAGRGLDLKGTQPKYGMGDVSETLYLRFGRSVMAPSE